MLSPAAYRKNNIRCFPANILFSDEMRLFLLILLLIPLPAYVTASHAQGLNLFSQIDGGKLTTTGGVSQVEGAGGGGLVPWSLIAGNETRDGIGGAVHSTYVPVSDFSLYSPGMSVGLYDRIELSYAADLFDTNNAGAKLGIGRGFTFHQDVLGLKIKLFGDAIYDQNSLVPQIAIGVQYKRNENAQLLHALGAKNADGADFYVAATKLFLNESLLVNTTIRLTRANQFGLLGFGGDRGDAYQPEFEGSVALQLSKNLLVGGEYRMKPNNLTFAKEGNVFDFFTAYFFTKSVSTTLGYVDLGSVARFSGQRGAYMSLQFSL